MSGILAYSYIHNEHTHMSSPHLAVLPVVLVLGVATSATAIHSLPRSSSSLLCVEQFRAQPSIDTLTQLIHEVSHYSRM